MAERSRLVLTLAGLLLPGNALFDQPRTIRPGMVMVDQEHHVFTRALMFGSIERQLEVSQ